MVRKWTNKLYAKYVRPDGSELLAPLLNITPTFNTPHIYEHSIDKDNVNVSRGNFTYTFTMLVRALRDQETGKNSAKILTEFQQKGLEFDILLAELQQNEESGKQWSFDKILMKKCYITSLVATNNQGASPTQTFSCIAGEITVDGESYNGSSNQQV